QRGLGLMLAATAATLFLVSYFGSLFPVVKAWQPLRFKVAFDLVLVFPAAYTSARWLAERPRGSYIVPTAWALGTAALFVNVITSEAGGRMLPRTQISPEIRAIMNWIQTETPVNARVLFEESGDETGFVYDGMYLSAFVPHRTGRELIGGPINLYNDRHHFAEFHSGKLFKKEVHRLTDDELRNYFRFYNVGAVVSFHPASIQRLQAIPGLVKIKQRIGPVHLMTVDQPFTWFLQGSGKLKAELNRIELSEVSGDEIILKYHWTDGLTATPEACIVPHKLLDDPIPFIKIIKPPRELTLSIKR
ncbi:MAG TPA: hypothetical protein VHM64_25120, partial [Candidatus Binatia bacterium]|nr:hypothetical protein [Candidatus Binatia bacterium]